MPTNSKDYIHRVGRTARAGKSGKAITFVTQYDIELLQRIESVIGKKMEEYPAEKEEVLLFQERVAEAQKVAILELKEFESKNKKRRKPSGADTQDFEDNGENVKVSMNLNSSKKKNRGSGKSKKMNQKRN
ncbi:hypothetical protein BB560_006069 [Smittium megazygosporum]|uniref:Helicase C-terminal domain-containing protein n=1 Tax=Smittium megazygosporum TaxID=133381 RepID=A0A2T9YIY2_9FUNG|nr:hypothetical protein BB560_006069 [Smittium megazygosporum]